MGRRLVYDVEDMAREMRQTFTDRPVEYVVELPFEWPAVLQNVGDSLAVAYASDKWKGVDKNGRRELELYKHIAESRNRVLVRPGLLRDMKRPEQKWPVVGPKVRLGDLPMPRHYAVLGLFEEADLQLYQYEARGGRKRESFHFSENPKGDCVEVKIRHAIIGGSKILWSKEDAAKGDEPFLFVYTEDDGILMIIVGDELDVQKDGITG